MFITEQYEVDYRQMMDSSIYSNIKPCLHIKVKINIELMEINSERDSQAELAQNRIHSRDLV